MRDVADLLTLYGVVEDEEREQFLILARNSRQPDWWHRYGDLLPKWFEDYLGLEQAATLIKTFELQYIPGLLQTEEYARGIATRGRPQSAQGDVEGALMLRMRRSRCCSAGTRRRCGRSSTSRCSTGPWAARRRFAVRSNTSSR